MESFFICSICGNDDLDKVGFLNNSPYCRACIRFRGEQKQGVPLINKSTELNLNYELTDDQQNLSIQILECYRKQQHVMVDAVTGSGKTEIVFAVIQEALNHHQRVGMIIPRRDVVIELLDRFKKVFPHLKISALYGGQPFDPTSDFIIMTTHQIYQFKEYFDLLIFDEVDAFPYAGNSVLKALVKRALKGVIVYLSATFSYEDMRDFKHQGGKVVHLYTRYHQHPLPQLTVRQVPRILYNFVLLYELKHMLGNHQIAFIFVPTIMIGRMLAWWLLPIYAGGAFVHSKHDDRDALVQKFKQGKLRYLITTSILERGITMVDLQVIIYDGSHVLFDEKTIVQMAGRVGRKRESPSGKVVVICEQKTADIKKSITRIHHANHSV
jgi:competence protein ComFA